MGSLLGDSPADSTETDEGDETDEEVERRHQWIEYYLSNKQYKEAEEIGWDAQHLGRSSKVGKKAQQPPAAGEAIGPNSAKQAQMVWLERGVEEGLQTPTSGLIHQWPSAAPSAPKGARRVCWLILVDRVLHVYIYRVLCSAHL